MDQINKLRLLSDLEKKFIQTPNKQRIKEDFKNPTVLRNRIREKSKNILSEIPRLIEEIILLYKFSIEEGLKVGSFDNGEEYFEQTILPCLFPPLDEHFDKFSENQKIIFLEQIVEPFLRTALNELKLNVDEPFKNYFQSIDAKKILHITVSRLYSSPLEYEEAFKQTYKLISTREHVKTEMPVLTDTARFALQKSDEFLIIKLLWTLPYKERIVAFIVYMSGQGAGTVGVTRNEIEFQTGFDKRYITRYLKELIKKKIVKRIRRTKTDYYVWCTKTGNGRE